MVHELDPHFVDELLARWAAEGDIAEKQRKERENQQKKLDAKRRR